MSEWRGLANSEWHDPNRRVQGWAWCEGDCNTTCHKDALCRCCLAAEVEHLTGELAERDRRIEKALAYCDDWKPISFAWSIQRILEGES